MINYPKAVLDEIATQIQAFGSQVQSENPDIQIVMSMAPEPFLGVNNHSRGGAYPHPPSRPVTPSSLSLIYQTPNGTVPVGKHLRDLPVIITKLTKLAS